MSDTITARLRAICDLNLARARAEAGRHEYDGRLQDLSPAGVRAGLARLAPPTEPATGHDQRQLAAAEHALRVRFGELALHRRNPLWHLDNLELMGYEREYAPLAEREAARLEHLRGWPDAVDAAIEALDQVPAPMAVATVGLARGLAEQLRPSDGATGEAATKALTRLIEHLDWAAQHGPPDAALGADQLALLLSSAEACEVDLDALESTVDGERDRMLAMLTEACNAVDSSATPREIVRRLRADHPTMDTLLDSARATVADALAWTERKALAPYTDGECHVGLMPDSQRFALAALFPAAPYEADAPSLYLVTPPLPSWSAAEQDEWLANGFNAMVLPNLAVHEVAPGHFSHFRALRRLTSDVRRTIISDAFCEGWAHYCEELAVEEGFREGDPSFTIGVALDALRRVTRFACALGVHSGRMTIEQAAARFTADALLDGQAALAEAHRAFFDPTYGRYTWGKIAIRELREHARKQWGAGFSLPRFHAALFALGSPPLGLISTALAG